MRRRSLLIMAILSGVTAAGLVKWREQLIIRRPLLQINFEHHDHGAVRCATCHHNFFDNTGRDACYFCHKIRPELALRIEQDFHVFCRDCHVQIAQRGIRSGPLRGCAGCHHDPTGVAVMAGEKPLVRP